MPEVEITVPARPTVVPVPVAPIPTVTAPTVEVTTPVVSVVPAPSPRPMLEEWEAGLSEYETVFDFVGSIVYVGEAKAASNSLDAQVWRIGRFNEADENPSMVYCNSGEFVSIWTNRLTGWRIKPPEQDIDIVLVGNLYPEDPNQPWRAPTTGDYHTSINTNLSMNLIEFDSGGGGGGGTVTVDAEEIADAVWNRAMSDHTAAGTFGRRLRELLPASIRRR